MATRYKIRTERDVSDAALVVLGNTSGTNTGDQTAGGGLTVARLGASTYSTVQHIQDLFHSTGWTSGGAITSNGNGTCAVAAGTGLIRASDSDVAVIYFTNFAANATLALTDNDDNYIYVEYNAGTPQVVATTTARTDFNTNILIAEIYREGNTLHINETVKIGVSDHASKMVRFNKEVMPYAHVSGGMISASGTRNLAITAGTFWQGLNKFTTTSFDSSVAGTFRYFYRNGIGGWTEQAAQTQINNTQYDDGDGTLGTLIANKYGVHWVYMGAEATSDVYVVFGQGEYTLTQAQDSQPPSTLPEIISSHSFIIGKIIIKKSDAAFAQIESTYEMMFSPSVATEHNALSGLQGGAASEYHHLTSAQATVAGNTSGTNTGDNSANTLYSGLVSNATHTGDAEGATALTVKKINGVALSGLATGILKNTTGTGVPSVAINSDLPTMSATAGGAVPTPPNNTTTFLRGDGTFATPTASATITTQDEGVPLSTTVTTLNFTGAGVTASGAGATTTINIPGGGSFAVTETEVDFGTTPTTDKTFTVTDVAITGTSKIMVTESGSTGTGRVAGGDSLWDSISYSCVPATGSFTLYAKASGAVVGFRKLFYTYS